ncbi:single-stranded-DNA-specific exonuclease RecJ [Patescibacteria group bacterium]
MFKKWQIATPIKDKVKEKFPEINAILLQLLFNRGINTQDKIDEFLNSDYGEDLYDPFLFKDMRKAIDRVLKAIENNEKITIFGDYDADGVTSVVVLEKAIKSLEIRNWKLEIPNVDVYIPHRGKEGYGLNEKAIKLIKENGSSLIVTVDCGISNYEVIDYANDLGFDVIITDHHQPPEKLPNAFAIINPKVSGEKYPFKDLAGVGVAFKFAQALVKDTNKRKLEPVLRHSLKLRRHAVAESYDKAKHESTRIGESLCHSALDAESRSRSRIKCPPIRRTGGMTNETAAGTMATSPDKIKWLLDLVAIGTVADCSPLVGENRTLVKYGLIVLNKTRNLGLKALIESAGLAKTQVEGVRCCDIERQMLKEVAINVNTWNIGFQIAPRLNAAGRLDHANTAYQLLITESVEEARRITLLLNEANNKRQEMTKKATDEAKKIIEKDQKDNLILFAKNNNWQAGIIGLVAGRISEQYYRPVFIFTKIDKKSVASGRSIPEFDVTKALKQTEEYLERYGGHSQACGLELKSEKKYGDFLKKFLKIADEKLHGFDLTPLLHIDGEIKAENVNWETWDNLQKIEPYGMVNPQPIFLIRDLQIMEVRIIGKDSNHLKLRLGCVNETGTQKIINAIGFSLNDKERAWGEKLKVSDFIDVAGRIDVNEWNGNRELQMKIVDLRLSEKVC